MNIIKLYSSTRKKLKDITLKPRGKVLLSCFQRSFYFTNITVDIGIKQNLN